jgi:hypothetical protein
MRKVSDKSCRESQNTRFMFNNFPKTCHLWDNVAKYGRAGQATDNNIIRLMPFACWKTKATNKHTIRNNYCFSTTTMVTRKRLNVTLYYIVCLVQLYVLSILHEITYETGTAAHGARRLH